nr:cytochrome P450 2H2-like [Chelonoidis abingdonii]
MEPLGATTVFLLICVSCFLFLSAWRKMSGNGKLPPGPVAFPIIGNTLQLSTRNLPQSIHELSAKYGPVFTIYVGSLRVVVLYGQEAVKEALIDQGDEFSGRGKLALADKLAKGTGIIFSNGERWKQLRRFALTTLRNFGMGKKSVEERIQEEAHFLVERLRRTHGGELLHLYNFFPTLMDYIPGPHQELLKNSEELRIFVLERVKMHKESLDLSCPRDFIDAFLIKMEQEQQNDQSEFNAENLVRSTLDLFLAGTGTTSTTLRHGLLILLKYPDIEEFNPGHFLDENGAFRKSDFFIPFSAGKRICVGEALARMELFLLLTTILQNFTLKSLIDPKDIDITPLPSTVVNAPKPYQLCVLPR